MLFFLRKLIEALLLPIGISGILTIAGVVFRRRSIALAGVATLYAFSTQTVGRLMMQPLERTYAPMTVAASPSADAIVVLAGSILRGVTASGPQWGRSANRFFAGIDLALAGKAKFIVISAGDSPGRAAVLRQIAIRDGIPPGQIVLTHRVFTTADEARAVSEIPGIHSILLVTSAFHLPRATLLFRARGLDVKPFPTDERILAASPSNFQFIPDSSQLEESEDAMREYYGLAVYRTILFSPEKKPPTAR
jgi:uncharacterized SAM-binding protein YcdF (DUF218 family)